MDFFINHILFIKRNYLNINLKIYEHIIFIKNMINNIKNDFTFINLC